MNINFTESKSEELGPLLEIVTSSGLEDAEQEVHNGGGTRHAGRMTNPWALLQAVRALRSTSPQPNRDGVESGIQETSHVNTQEPGVSQPGYSQ